MDKWRELQKICREKEAFMKRGTMETERAARVTFEYVLMEMARLDREEKDE